MGRASHSRVCDLLKAFTLLALIGCSAAADAVLEVTPTTFDEVVLGREFVVAKFFAPWW